MSRLYTAIASGVRNHTITFSVPSLPAAINAAEAFTRMSRVPAYVVDNSPALALMYDCADPKPITVRR